MLGSDCDLPYFKFRVRQQVGIRVQFIYESAMHLPCICHVLFLPNSYVPLKSVFYLYMMGSDSHLPYSKFHVRQQVCTLVRGTYELSKNHTWLQDILHYN